MADAQAGRRFLKTLKGGSGGEEWRFVIIMIEDFDACVGSLPAQGSSQFTISSNDFLVCDEDVTRRAQTLPFRSSSPVLPRLKLQIPSGQNTRNRVRGQPSRSPSGGSDWLDVDLKGSFSAREHCGPVGLQGLSHDMDQEVAAAHSSQRVNTGKPLLGCLVVPLGDSTNGWIARKEGAYC